MTPRAALRLPGVRGAVGSVLAFTMLIGGSLLLAAEPAAPIALRPVALMEHHLEEGPLLEPMGVAVDRESGEVWVADTKNHMVAVFTPEGMPLFAGRPGSAVREPMRLLLDGPGRVLVIDNDRSRIAVLNWRGEYQGPLALPGLPERPIIAAFARDERGYLYVGESAKGEVLVYDEERKLRFRFGSRGEDEGQFLSIAAIAVDPERIVVLDHRAIAVQIFDRHGNFVRGFGTHDLGIENFSLPQGVVLDSKGHIIAVDGLRHEIKVFDLRGRFMGRFGGMGKVAGAIAYPMDIAIDAEDRIYVAEKGNGRVQVFASTTPAPTGADRSAGGAR